MSGSMPTTATATTTTALTMENVPHDIKLNILAMAVESLKKENDNLKLSNAQQSADVQRLTAERDYYKNRSRILYSNNQVLTREKGALLNIMHGHPYGMCEPVTPPNED